MTTTRRRKRSSGKTKAGGPFFEHVKTVVQRSGPCSVLADPGKPTCFSDDALRLLAESHNSRAEPDAPRVDPSARPAEVQRALRAIMRRRCGDNPHCWVERAGLPHEPAVTKWLKPSKPPGHTWREFENAWLTTRQIDEILRRYEPIYPKFAFLGVHPVDFQEYGADGRCVGGTARAQHVDLCRFDVAKLLAKGKTSFALVANTDASGQPGEHWVAVWCGMDSAAPNYGVYFYDSNGSYTRREIPRRIRSFMKSVKEQMRGLPGHAGFPDEMHNEREQQKRDGQCGMYAACFVVAMLTGHDFREYMKERGINDKLMTHLRRAFFAHAPSSRRRGL